MTPVRNRPRRVRPALVVLSTLVVTALLLAQASGPQTQAPPKEKEAKKEEKEKPRGRIFTGKIALRSSRQESETATYGFKGVGQDGQVEKAALGAQPSGDDYQKVTGLAAYQVPRDELEAFLQQGHLRGRGTAESPTAGQEKKP